VRDACVDALRVRLACGFHERWQQVRSGGGGLSVSCLIAVVLTRAATSWIFRQATSATSPAAYFTTPRRSW
jgi:hypothetical protein